MQIYKLGKLPPKIDHRTLQMSRYRIPGAIQVPEEVSWVTKLSNLGMMLNDQLGDCAEAATGHSVQQWTTYAGKTVIPSDSAVETMYEDAAGYVPGQPSTDQGSVLINVLNYWRKTGIGGHKILAYVQVNPLNLQEVREAIYLFGNVYTGIQLPISAQDADSWTVSAAGTPNGVPGSWGGHCIPIMAQSPETLTCVTWGSLLKMSHNFALDYIDEMYAIVSQDWIEANGLSPSQFNLAQLQADLNIVTA